MLVSFYLGMLITIALGFSPRTRTLFRSNLHTNLNLLALIPSNQQVSNFEIVRPKHMTAPVSNRNELSKRLTSANRVHSGEGTLFRKRYMKLRLLTEEEEETTGKFTRIGKKLDSIKKDLIKKFGKEPSDSQWADACGMTVVSLKLYHSLAQKARNRLVEHNLRLVDFWVRKLMEHSKGAKEVSYYELLVEGIIGLSRAAEHFDGRGRFGYYAQFYIRQALYDGLTKLRPGSFASPRAIKLFFKSLSIQKQLTVQLERKPTDEEIAKKLEVKVSTLHAIQKAYKQKVISADTSMANSQDSTNGGADVSREDKYLDLFLKADQSKHNSDSLLWRIEFNSVLDCLPPQEKRTVAIRYGLLDGQPRTIERTANLMCMSTENARLTILKAFDKLRSQSDLSFLEGPPKAPVTTISSDRKAVKMY